VETTAKITSKGQVTVPKAVRDALGLSEGDEVVFRVEDNRATISKPGDFIAAAGSVPVPPGKAGTPWDEIIRSTHDEVFGKHR
jgi:AbrB family looped-hinge helix DNA binding protein